MCLLEGLTRQKNNCLCTRCCSENENKKVRFNGRHKPHESDLSGKENVNIFGFENYLVTLTDLAKLFGGPRIAKSANDSIQKRTQSRLQREIIRSHIRSICMLSASILPSLLSGKHFILQFDSYQEFNCFISSGGALLY